MHGYGNITFLVDGNEYEGQFKKNLEKNTYSFLYTL